MRGAAFGGSAERVEEGDRDEESENRAEERRVNLVRRRVALRNGLFGQSGDVKSAETPRGSGEERPIKRRDGERPKSEEGETLAAFRVDFDGFNGWDGLACVVGTRRFF